MIINGSKRKRNVTGTKKVGSQRFFLTQDTKIDIVRLTGIKQSTVYSLLKRYEERGDLENKRRSGRQTEFTDRDSRFQCLLASKISLCLPAGQSVGKVASLYSCLTGK